MKTPGGIEYDESNRKEVGSSSKGKDRAIFETPTTSQNTDFYEDNQTFETPTGPPKGIGKKTIKTPINPQPDTSFPIFPSIAPSSLADLKRRYSQIPESMKGLSSWENDELPLFRPGSIPQGMQTPPLTVSSPAQSSTHYPTPSSLPPVDTTAKQATTPKLGYLLTPKSGKPDGKKGPSSGSSSGSSQVMDRVAVISKAKTCNLQANQPFQPVKAEIGRASCRERV